MFQDRLTSRQTRPLRYAAATPALAAAVLLGVTGCGSGEDGESGAASSVGSTSASGSGPEPSGSGPSSTTSATAPAASSSAPASPSSPAGRTIEVTVTGSEIDPAPATVDLAVGETLTLVVTSDHDDELHAHGFEVEESLTAGEPTSITLTGETPGVYEVETHEPALRLLQVAVR